eukprot:3538047-Lingulodinium_polyedra.AAC.1
MLDAISTVRTGARSRLARARTPYLLLGASAGFFALSTHGTKLSRSAPSCRPAALRHRPFSFREAERPLQTAPTHAAESHGWMPRVPISSGRSRRVRWPHIHASASSAVMWS